MIVLLCLMAAFCAVGSATPKHQDIPFVKDCLNKSSTDHSKCGILYWDNSTWAKEANKHLDFYEKETYKLLLEQNVNDLLNLYAEDGILAAYGINATIGRNHILPYLQGYAPVAKQLFDNPRAYYRHATADLDYLIHRSIFCNTADNASGIFYQLYRRVDGSDPVKYQLQVDSFFPALSGVPCFE